MSELNMKDLNEEEGIRIQIQTKNLIKYFLMFFVVSMSALTIPTCGVLKKHAYQVGLMAATTFVIIDVCFPNYVSA
tara:strand:- start:234 stop:461 length:228 start_codon:yes stop_codon:yes gene_type:complete